LTEPKPPIERLLAIMARLRDPERGCPWDKEQTYASIAPYTIEEAYEVADAIQRGDISDLKDELGDLLLQVVFQSRIAEERGDFTFDAVAEAICEKMVRRHPHVFADESYDSVEAQTESWEAIKAAERKAKAAGGVLDDVPPGLPALARAVKLTKRAGRVGFDWPDAAAVLEKMREEVLELEAEIAAGDKEAAREELGDLLFVCANLARKLGVDPEDALRGANAKFTRRFRYIEAALDADGRGPTQSTLEEMEGLWTRAKLAEKGG
jgi:tetrapyrrole methylase family protein/MazG family protein/ATP diphosphatase